MKVLFISTEDAKYGAPKSMKKLIQTLKTEHGVECVLLTKNHNQLNDWCNDEGIENYSCNYRDIMAGDSYETWILNAGKHVVKYLRYLKGGISQKKIDSVGIDFSTIDLIHSNTNRVDIGAYISKKYNIPHIWHLREMDEGTKNMHYYKKHCMEYMNNNADKFIAITEAVKSSWVRHGLDEKKTSVIYNGIDPQDVKVKNTPIFSDDKIKIVGVGRIERAKGQLDIINAVCDLPSKYQQQVQLDFIGEAYNDYKKLIVDRIKKSDCKADINFLGYKSNVGELLQNYDVGITCSAAEAFGRTTVEYMMAGLLTIASDTGANPELIKDGETGLIYHFGDSNSLKDIITEIIDNRKRYSDVAVQGYNSATEKFNSKRNEEQIYECYSEFMN